MDDDNAQGASDIAGGTIRWFGWLMVAVFIASAACACMALWGLWQLVRYVFGG
jgi:hypothetical protein